MVQSFPTSLRNDISLQINNGFIQQVRFLTHSEPEFVSDFINRMRPIICLANDYIVRKDEMAVNMYFIKNGFVKVLYADNEEKVLSYMGEGSFFGEIGVLLTGKRSVSVVSETNCTLFVIDKDSLLLVLSKSQVHETYLKSVGKQRLRTTNTYDNVESSSSNSEDSNSEEDKCIKEKKNKNHRESKFKANSATELERIEKINNVVSTFSDWQLYTEITKSKLKKFYMWILLLCMIWQIIYIPFAIGYEDFLEETNPAIIFIETISYLVFLFDTINKIYCHMK